MSLLQISYNIWQEAAQHSKSVLKSIQIWSIRYWLQDFGLAPLQSCKIDQIWKNDRFGNSFHFFEPSLGLKKLDTKTHFSFELWENFLSLWIFRWDFSLGTLALKLSASRFSSNWEDFLTEIPSLLQIFLLGLASCREDSYRWSLTSGRYTSCGKCATEGCSSIDKQPALYLSPAGKLDKPDSLLLWLLHLRLSLEKSSNCSSLMKVERSLAKENLVYLQLVKVYILGSSEIS